MTSTENSIDPADQAAVAALTETIVKAWAAHDAEAFGDVFVEDATMILPGVFRKGREEITAFMSEAFAGPYRGTQVTGTPIDMRFLGPDVALLLTEGGVIEADRTELTDAGTIRASWFAVKRAGQWYLAAYQNSPRD